MVKCKAAICIGHRKPAVRGIICKKQQCLIGISCAGYRHTDMLLRQQRDLYHFTCRCLRGALQHLSNRLCHGIISFLRRHSIKGCIRLVCDLQQIKHHRFALIDHIIPLSRMHHGNIFRAVCIPAGRQCHKHIFCCVARQQHRYLGRILWIAQQGEMRRLLCRHVNNLIRSATIGLYLKHSGDFSIFRAQIIIPGRNRLYCVKNALFICLAGHDLLSGSIHEQISGIRIPSEVKQARIRISKNGGCVHAPLCHMHVIGGIQQIPIRHGCRVKRYILR